MDPILQYQIAGGLLLVGLLLGLIPLALPRFLSPRYRGAKTEETYECGVDTIGTAWMRFSISFYLFALIFVAFEVDILYLFPVALVFDEPAMGWRGVVEMALFLGILSLALVFAWRRGVFKWE